MIKNDRQYRMTKAQARSFGDALRRLRSAPLPAGVDPALKELENRALKSQLEELNSDVSEYEALKSGAVTVFDASSIVELPLLLVKARIARGLTQRQLAERLKVKEQQVQRWEGNNYQGASLETMKAVADALRVALRQELIIPKPDLTARSFLASLKTAGISAELILERILPSKIASVIRDGVAQINDIAVAASALARVFGIKTADLLTLKGTSVVLPEVAPVRFKLPARANHRSVDAYTVYAHYISAVLVDAIEESTSIELPSEPLAFYKTLTKLGHSMTFAGALEQLWRCGIITVPLRETGGFHGAVWKIKGRFVIILKQTTDLESRWLYDLLHETGHIVNGHVTSDMAVVEENEISPEGGSANEDTANEWAEDAMFGCRSEEIEEACTKACQGQLQKLKTVLPSIATQFNVNLGSLANHMAYRLAQQGQNWWGAANNLQLTCESPFSITREALLRHANLRRLGDFDRDLVQRSLSEG